MDASPTPVPLPAGNLPATAGIHAPALFAADPAAEKRFWEFFTVTIRNRDTRLAYLRAAARFGDWCGDRGLAHRDGSPQGQDSALPRLGTPYDSPARRDRPKKTTGGEDRQGCVWGSTTRLLTTTV